MPQSSEAVKGYMKRMKAAADYAERKFFARADRMVRLYKVDHYYDKGPSGSEYQDSESDRVKVAYPYANSRQILAEVNPDDPQPIVRVEKRTPDPVEFGDQIIQGSQEAAGDPDDAAAMMKGSILYVTRKSNFKREMKMAVLDGIVTGLGVAQLVAQVDGIVPKFVRLLYRDVLIEYGSVTDPYQSDFVAVKEVRRLDLIRKDDRLREGARKEVQSAHLDESQYGNSHADVEFGIIWHLFDKRENVYLCFADGQDFELQKGSPKLTDLYDLPCYDDEFQCDWPFAFFVNEEIPDECWGMGDIFPIESQVRELDRFRTRWSRHTKSFLRKYVVAKGSLGKDGMNQLKAPVDGGIIEVPKETNPLNAIVPLADAPLSPDQYRVEEAIKTDLQIIQPIGADSVSRGVGNQPDTLGQAQIIEQNANTRLADKQRTVSKFYGRAFFLIAYYVKQYWTMEQELLVSGDGSKDGDWVNYRPMGANFQLDYDVAPESMRDNTQAYRSQLSTALATLAPIWPLLQQSPGLALITRKYLETFETVGKEADKIVPDEWIDPPAVPAPLPGQDGQGGTGDPLLDLIHGSDPRQFVDSVKSLPENERAAIQSHIARISGGSPAAPAQPSSPQPAPSPFATR